MVPRRLMLSKAAAAAALIWSAASATAVLAASTLDVAIGKRLFERNWVPAPASTKADEGLGPFYDARSCASCHGGAPTTVVRLGSAAGIGDSVYGEQLQMRAIPGLEPESMARIDWVGQGGLRKPVVTVERANYGPMANDTRLGLRRAPSLNGIGLLARIPEEAILGRACLGTDGVVGRPSYVTVHGKRVLGRFGWKATEPDLSAQTAAAFSRDLGLSTRWHPDPYGDCTAAEHACRAAPHGGGGQGIEISDVMVGMIAAYVASLPASASASREDPKGEGIFQAIGCSLCHASYRLADGTRIAAYTDLLLHDMGEGLNDGIKEGAANPGEWRTAPLLGVAPSAMAQSLLHDGRARTITEAIEWHGGEGARARARFEALSSQDKEALLRFVAGL